MSLAVRAFDWRELRASLEPRALRVMLVSLLAVTLSTADQSLFSYAIPEITREFGVGLEVIGQILSASFLVASAAVVVVGIVADELGRRRVLIVLLALSALCVGAHALAPSIELLALLRILGFALGAGLYPIANTLVVEASPDRHRGFVSGLLQIGYPLGFAVAALLAVPLMQAAGWRAMFYVAFLIVLLAPLLGRALPESPRFEAQRSEPGERGVRRLSRLLRPDLRRRALVCFGGSFLVSLAIGGTTYFLPTYLVQAHGVSTVQAGGIAGVSYAIGAIGYVAAAYIGEFVTTRRNTLVIWIFMGAAAFAATLWLAEARWALIAGLGLSILFFYGSEAVRMPLIGELFPTEVRATATAATGSLAVTTAWLVSPLLISYLAPTIGWPATFTVCAIVPLALGGCVFLLLVNLPSGIKIELASRPT